MEMDFLIKNYRTSTVLSDVLISQAGIQDGWVAKYNEAIHCGWARTSLNVLKWF